jgi:hypothetical protein
MAGVWEFHHVTTIFGEADLFQYRSVNSALLA